MDYFPGCSKIFFPFVALGIFSIFSAGGCQQQTNVSIREAQRFTSQLPNFSLKDPAGKTFTRKDVLKKGGLILVVTAPILSNKEAQEGWDKNLEKVKSSKATLVFLQDMSPSSFKGQALSSMKKEYRPGKEPILLIDEKGELRQKLGVPEKATVVLAYDKKGVLVGSETQAPNASAGERLLKSAEK